MNVIAMRTISPYMSFLASNPIAARHLDFVNGLKRTRPIATWLAPVARVFRHTGERAAKQVPVAMHMALRLMSRFTVPNHDVVHGRASRTEIRTYPTGVVLHMLERQRILELRVREQREVPKSKDALPMQIFMREQVERHMFVPKVSMTLSKPRHTDVSRDSTIKPVEIKADMARRVGRVIDTVRNDKRTPVVLPEQELSRVTDHVIRQLDRRVLSYCERTGRV